MGVAYQVIWDTEALHTFGLIYNWYKLNRSHKAADKFRKSIEDTITRIQKSPHLGKRDRHLVHRNKEYRSFLSHPHYRLVYFLNDITIYIVAIRDNRMKP